MTRVRKTIIFMLLYLTVVFNLERWDIDGQNTIDIQTFVYGLILFAVLSIVMSKLLQRYTVYFSLALWLFVYIGLKLFVFNERPLLSGVYTYLSITEMALLAIAVFLAYDLAHALNEFEGIIEQVTIPKLGQRVFPLKSSREEVKTEFIRSRRHNRPLSVLVFAMDQKTRAVTMHKTIQDIQQAMLNRYMAASLAQLISAEARRTDMIMEQENGNGFVILCPETGSEGSAILASRIQKLATERLGMQVNIGRSSFPDEALTFDELLQKAQFKMIKPDTLTTYIEEEASPPEEILSSEIENEKIQKNSGA